MVPYQVHHSPENRCEVFFERAALGVPASVGLLRDLTEFHLDKWGLSAMRDNACLVVSELVTNAVAATPREVIGLRVRKWTTVLVVEVHDNSSGDAALTPLDHVSERGRGLLLVHAFSCHWGQQRLLDGSKYVYALLPIPATGKGSHKD